MEFTERQKQAQCQICYEDYGVMSSKLIELMLEDIYRKGCKHEDCNECEFSLDDRTCPLLCWKDKHPEFENDEHAKAIEAEVERLREEYKHRLP